MPQSERVVREPQQQRTRDAWNRVLEVGLELFIEGGLESLTVSEVCRRAEISPPSLYARVDGRAGLVAAVYEYAMVDVRASDERILSRLPDDNAPTAERVSAVVDALADQFDANRDVLRPMIAASMQDEWVHRRGAEEARRIIGGMGAALQIEEAIGRDIATMLFSELVLRTMYGIDFASPFAPDDAAFRDRLKRMALARAVQADAGE